ncbi:hypothetical protein FH972_021857 [Carpinus fangiana]|uniref:NADAR domain-containing protein n=1 Tax=Carpinus fangiana TaxID=176857 RepID=A0A5N6KQX3_9ROSI|nr:hypothetical protein FH972_021857 [Carpinus fangiana]
MPNPAPETSATNEPNPPAVPAWKAQQYSDRPIFFWKDDADYGFLCQWYLTPMTDASGQAFNCCEQYMMWRKAQTFDDAATMAAILKERKPRKQKALGRAVVGFDDAAWDRVKYDVVVQANVYKFRQGVARDDDAFAYPPRGRSGVRGQEDVTLRELLLATGERELVEASRFDRVWGIGYSEEAAERTSRKLWGQNLLATQPPKHQLRFEMRRRSKQELVLAAAHAPALHRRLRRVRCPTHEPPPRGLTRGGKRKEEPQPKQP